MLPRHPGPFSACTRWSPAWTGRSVTPEHVLGVMCRCFLSPVFHGLERNHRRSSEQSRLTKVERMASRMCRMRRRGRFANAGPPIVDVHKHQSRARPSAMLFGPRCVPLRRGHDSTMEAQHAPSRPRWTQGKGLRCTRHAIFTSIAGPLGEATAFRCREIFLYGRRWHPGTRNGGVDNAKCGGSVISWAANRAASAGEAAAARPFLSAGFLEGVQPPPQPGPVNKFSPLPSPGYRHW